MKRLDAIELMAHAAVGMESRIAAMETLLLHDDYDAAEVFQVFAATETEVAAVDRLLDRD